MAVRDPELVRRMYGARTAPPEGRAIGGIWPLLWIGALLVAFVSAVTVAFGTLIVAAISGVSPLERAGIIEPDELEIWVHEHAPEGAGGCVVTGRRVVRWDGLEPSAAVNLRGAEISVDGSGVHAINDAEAVDCPFAAGEDPEPFAAAARRYTGR